MISNIIETLSLIVIYSTFILSLMIFIMMGEPYILSIFRIDNKKRKNFKKKFFKVLNILNMMIIFLEIIILFYVIINKLNYFLIMCLILLNIVAMYIIFEEIKKSNKSDNYYI